MSDILRLRNFNFLNLSSLPFPVGFGYLRAVLFKQRIKALKQLRAVDLSSFHRIIYGGECCLPELILRYKAAHLKKVRIRLQVFVSLGESSFPVQDNVITASHNRVNIIAYHRFHKGKEVELIFIDHAGLVFPALTYCADSVITDLAEHMPVESHETFTVLTNRHS